MKLVLQGLTVLRVWTGDTNQTSFFKLGKKQEGHHMYFLWALAHVHFLCGLMYISSGGHMCISRGEGHVYFLCEPMSTSCDSSCTLPVGAHIYTFYVCVCALPGKRNMHFLCGLMSTSCGGTCVLLGRRNMCTSYGLMCTAGGGTRAFPGESTCTFCGDTMCPSL